MKTYKMGADTQVSINKMAEECNESCANIVSEAIGLLEVAIEEAKDGNELYVVSKEGKALRSIKLNVVPSKVKIIKKKKK